MASRGTCGKKKVEVDPETAALIAEFLKFCETKGYTHCKPNLMEAVTSYLPEAYVAIEIKTMLTDGDDCDELLECYVRIGAVPGNDKLRVRTEIVNFVEGFAASKGIEKAEEMSF